MLALAERPLTRGLMPPPARVPSEEEIAALTIGGKVFLVDLGNYHLDGLSLAAIVRWDGSIGLEYARWHDTTSFKSGERAGLYDVVPDGNRIQESHGCVILGRVIERDYVI